MKKISIILSLFIALWGLKFTSYNLQIEGYAGLFRECLFRGHDTVFSENYTDKGFLKIKKGMAEEEVIEIIGKPLARSIMEENFIILQYSKSERSTHYRFRNIILINGIVTDVIGYYYVD